MKTSLCIFGLTLFISTTISTAQEADHSTPAAPGAQIRDEIPFMNIWPGFRDQAVVLDINARVIEQNMQEIWNESHQRVTIPGRPVGIKMVGTNVIVAAQFIPYLRRRGQNILVAQGQIWIDIPNQGIRYCTTMQTIPLDFDEAVYFFPLGSSANEDEARIEIILTMRPYKAPGVHENTAPEKPGDSHTQGINGHQ